MPVPLGRVAVTKAATPLPDPLEGLARSQYKVAFNRGQLVMIAGPPGGGKTTTALIMAIKMGVPTLYVSADSDETTMAARAASAISGHAYSTVRKAQELGIFEELYGEQVDALPIRFIFDPSEPSLDDIANAIDAYVEVHGQPPWLLVIDNLMNCRNDERGNDEWAGMRATVKALHWMARQTKACVWVLHHTSEQSDGWIEAAPPRSAIQGKLSQLPELILTIANKDGTLMVGVVKNRHGKSDPKAREPVRMAIDFVATRIFDLPLSLGRYQLPTGAWKAWTNETDAFSETD